MANQTSGEEVFRPYARLITILGDQLITNKTVAVNEIVKNSYDADADKVTVRFINFENFGKAVTNSQKPVIEIEDTGSGMSIDIIKNVWLRPATPYKFNTKKSKERFTKSGRLMQGEKGIGRFAVHKLGDTIDIYTKATGNDEVHLILKLAEYDKGQQLNLFKTQEDLDKNYKFLDEIKNKWEVNQTAEISKKGTLIRITDVRDNWTPDDLLTLSKSFSNLIPPSIPEDDYKKIKLPFKPVKDFQINIEWGKKKYKASKLLSTFETICKEAPFKFIARINKDGFLSYDYTSLIEKKRDISREINLLKNELNLTLYSINKRFYKTIDKEKHKTHDPTNGPFQFVLYGFDLYDKVKWNNRKDEQEFIKDNGIYLFRDGIRVYPYGNKEIDWLEISKKRAEWKAGDFFSYNDLIGFIFISHDENNKLKDASNREGLMDIDGAYEDFKALLIASIQVMKYESDLDKGKREKKKQAPLVLFKKNLTASYSNLSKKLEKIGDKATQEAAKKYLDNTTSYITEMNRRIDIYEDLAGLGLAVEKASHDAFSVLQKMMLNISDIKSRLSKNENISKKELQQIFSDLNDNAGYLFDQLQLLQPLFRISKRNETIISISDVTKKILRYFKLETDKNNIKIDVQLVRDIKMKTSTGFIFQILINLLDNSIYWLSEKGGSKDRRIIIKIDGNKNELTVGDSGVGIHEEQRDLVFMEFYSTKPKERGRGLGLYIVKEIVDRLDASIELLLNEKTKLLKGANFRITFPNDKK
jgi:two-component sensor histidine kinase